MFRLRHASGEEAIYRSVEELALGLRSGIIGNDTWVLDSAAHVWQPLMQHPLYAQASAIASTLTSYGDLELEAGRDTLIMTPSGQQQAIPAVPRPVYQMASISGAELEARRQQKALIKGGIVAAAVLIVATSGFAIWRQRGHPDSGEMNAGPRQVAPTTQRVSRLAPSTAYWLSPAILAARRDEAQTRIDRALTDSSTALAWDGVIALGRLLAPDSLRSGLQRLEKWRGLVERYRQASVAMIQAYQDSANAQVRSDQWSLLDANDWKSRPSPAEGSVDAIRMDSLVGGVQKLYELLLSQQGQYQLEPAKAEFTAHRARIEYRRLAGILQRHGPAGGTARGVSVPLLLLRFGLEGPGLPPVPPEPETP